MRKHNPHKERKKERKELLNLTALANTIISNTDFVE
jgi:hypothetical protein